MNILLIGGNGFVGEELAKELILNNHSVSYLSRNENKNIKNCKWIKADIFKLENIDLSAERFDIAIHLIGTIKNKKLYTKLNIQSVEKSIELCKKYKIEKIIYLSAQGGFREYVESKQQAENVVINSDLNYIIVKPGLMYGKNRLSSYFNVIPIRVFSSLGIKFFSNVYPLPVSVVAKKIVNNLELNYEILGLNQLKNNN